MCGQPHYTIEGREGWLGTQTPCGTRYPIAHLPCPCLQADMLTGVLQLDDKGFVTSTTMSPLYSPGGQPVPTWELLTSVLGLVFGHYWFQ